MYRLREDVVLEELCGAYILVALRPAWKEYPFAIRISGSSAMMWKCVRDGVPTEETLRRLREEHGMPPEKAERIYMRFIEYCRKKKYIIPESSI